MRLERDRPPARLGFAPAGPGRSDGWLLFDEHEIGWFEPFEDPLLDTATLRLWLNAAPLSGGQLSLVSGWLAGHLGALADPGAACTVESNRIFPIRGAEPASALLRFDARRPPCGTCRWRRTGCDEWFIDELVKSFIDGYRRLGAHPAAHKMRRYVTSELAAYPDWQWWSLWCDGARSGVVVSSGHEDPADGRPYAQCVDAVGRHSQHFSCLAAQLSADVGCEVRGEVTVGLEWSRERRVLGRLHAEGWRLRGLTSLIPPAPGSSGSVEERR
ncbi:MAG: hypothetical protein ACRD0C_14260 [Acidimicrobiia bacterium]